MANGRDGDVITATVRKTKKKLSAHDKVEWALQIGKLTRGVCEICGKPNASAHHDDYNKPLEVRWLCDKHHAQLHARE